MSKKLIISLVFCLLTAASANAQFYLQGSDPGNLRWSQICTPGYRIVYPEGMDSLARSYALALEDCRYAVGTTVGFYPNQNWRNPMPVVLHPYSVRANGSVSWAPRIMNLVTTPDTRGVLPMSNVEQLVIHESRHVAQMQFCNWDGFRYGEGIFGQMWAGAICAVYPGPALLEGDAVVAETELSRSGRGRNADFLEYYRVCLGAGLRRDFWQWRYGSQRRFTPDHYRAGYVLVAGMRDVFDCPDFATQYYRRIADKGLPFWNLQKTVREVSGLRFKDAFNLICDSLDAGWARERALRAPFDSAEQISPAEPLFTEDVGSDLSGNSIYAIRRGIARTPALVKITTDGKIQRLAPFGSSTSQISADGKGHLYWSEILPDLRWEQRSFSDIFASDTTGRRKRLTRGDKLFNPSPSVDGEKIAAVRLPVSGGSEAVVLNASDGSETGTFPCPDSLQLTETIWLGDTLFAAAVGRGGSGIYMLEATGPRPVMEPVMATVSGLSRYDGYIFFTADIDGTNELYRLDTACGSLTRITSNPYGGDDFKFSDDGSTLYGTRLLPHGRFIFATPSDSLRPQPACTGARPWRQADKLSSQARASGIRENPSGVTGEPEHYSKFANSFRFHSWAPLYVDIDRIKSISYENLFQTVGLGVTGFFQNDLGTLYGAGAVRVNPSDIRRTGAYARFTCTGLFPVMELTVSGNMRDAVTSRPDTTFSRGCGNIEGNFRAYVPLNFSSGGWRRGVIPQISVIANNDLFTGVDGIERSTVQITAGVRGYAMLPVASSGIYPRWGIGAEAGYARIPGANTYTGRNFYGDVYGYVPGIFPTHGIRLEAYASTRKAYVSLDYAIPFAPVDWSALSPAFYLRNFELIPHLEYNWIYGYVSRAEAQLPPFRYGADLVLRLENFLWIPFPTRIGISARNTGVSFIFGIDI